MSYIKEKVSYIRGLFEGLEIRDTAQQKMYQAIIDALDVIADAVEENEAALDDLNESMEDVMEELDILDMAVFEDEEEDGEEDEEFVELTCPHCGDVICLDQEMLTARTDLICPNCNEPILPEAEEGLDSID